MTFDINSFGPAGPGPGEGSRPASQTLSYVDKRKHSWPYWPLSAADQMWREVKCNQSFCNRPATFVGVCDIHGDGIEYFDGAAAWCYWCMPRELMNPEAQRAAKIADWARQETAVECIALVEEAQSGIPSTAEDALTDVYSAIRYVTESRESMMASPDSANMREAYEGWEPKDVRRYEQRAKGNKNPPYQAQAVTQSCGV